jgi:hypothetical protein
MSGSCIELNGVRIFQCSSEGPKLSGKRDAIELMSMASEHAAGLIVISSERLGDDFFDLRTRRAGEMIQKFLTYGSRVAIVGNISRRVAESKSLAALVAELNRGHHAWLLENMDELAKRLAPTASGPNERTSQ